MASKRLRFQGTNSAFPFSVRVIGDERSAGGGKFEETVQPIKIIDANTAAEFWELLSPEKPLFSGKCDLLYRGQADQHWHLTPSILRMEICTLSDNQVFKEWVYLHSFVEHCDLIGLSIPNDTPAFREDFLNQNAPAGPARAFINTSYWPPPEMYALLALAQHHRVPTRLLDWSTRSYVAAYFAISDALRMIGNSNAPELFAVWVLDIERQALYSNLEVVRVPGSNNANLAAQAGRFTFLKQEGVRAEPFRGEISLDLYLAEHVLPLPLLKVTLPITEAAAALRLCSLYGVNGATLFPDYSGAARATEDAMRTAIRLM